MRVYTLEREQIIPAPLEDVFPFFSLAENLERLTPRTLQFKIETPMPIEMRVGALIDYRLKLFGVPFRWQTEITRWDPPRGFTDVQKKGPYLLWEHKHDFESVGGETRMTDHLRYAIPGGPFAPLVHSLFVGGQVRAIFDFRESAIQEAFRPPA